MTDNYYHTKASVDEYIKMAGGYDGSELIEALKKVLPPGSSVLEIGSGPGTDWKILDEIFRVTGSDYSKEFLSRLTIQHPREVFLELDASTLITNETFDGIYSNKVLHHLTDEQLAASIKRQHAILNPDGIISHSFWNGEGDEVYNGLFVNYHTEVDLKLLIKDTFEILHIETYKEFDDDDSIFVIGRRND